MYFQKIRNLYLLNINILLIIVFSLIQFIIKEPVKDMTQLKIQAFLAIVAGFWCVISSHHIQKEFSFYTIFISMCLICYFGQQILILFNINIGTGYLTIMSGKLSNNDIIETQAFVLNCLLFLNIGYLLYNGNTSQEHKLAIIKTNSQEIEIVKSQNKVLEIYVKIKTGNLKYFRQIGYIFMILSILPAFYVQFAEIQQLQAVGYRATINANYSTIYKVSSVISGFYISSILILFITAHQKKQAIIPVIATVVYSALTLMGGTRLVVLKILVPVFLIEYFWNKHIKKCDLWKIAIFSYAILMVFSFISDVRNNIAYTSDIGKLISETWQDSLSHNLLVSILKEAGITQIINTVVHSNIPDVYGYQYGYCFLKAILSAVPNFWGGIHPSSIQTETIFNHLYTDKALLASSIVAETDFNFGTFSFIIMIIYGLGFSLLWKKFKKAIREQNIIHLFICSYLFFSLLTLVRQDMTQLGRGLIYYCFFPILMYYIFKKEERRE